MTALLVVGTALGVMADDLYENLGSTPESLALWNNKFMQLLPNGGPEGKYAVKMSCDNPKKGNMASFVVPVDKVKGKKVEFSAKVKAENVSKNAQGHLGIKFMVYYKTSAAEKNQMWAEGTVVNQSRCGSYDWKELKTEVMIPENAVAVRLTIGLQEVSGTVYFSDMDLEI